MPQSCRFLPWLIAALFAWTSVPVGATQWSCWYNLDQHVACVLLEALPAPPLRLSELRALESAPGIHVAAVRGRPSLPPAVQLLRSRPGALRGRVLFIPLHTEPLDHHHVAVLAQSVMCGAELGCRATYGHRPAESAEMAADFADANDPLLMVIDS